MCLGIFVVVIYVVFLKRQKDNYVMRATTACTSLYVLQYYAVLCKYYKSVILVYN